MRYVVEGDMCRILIFAGTVEGRKLAEYLNEHDIKIHVCVATEYGEKLLPKGDGISITTKRLEMLEMKALMLEESIDVVIDATHPYAVLVSQNIQQACKENKIEYMRVLRDSSIIDTESCIYVESIEEAVHYLKNTKGNVLITTGSKELGKYTSVPNYQKRFFARVLSTVKVVEECNQLGFEGENLICMQGPFSEEFNYALLKQINATYMVTKESGNAGGFEEKIRAAVRAKVKPIVIGRPEEKDGTTYDECLAILRNRLHLKYKRKITLLGIGMGAYENMTLEGVKACEDADIVIGAKRIIETLDCFHKPSIISYKPEEILEFIITHMEYEKVVIGLSGDTGFYSGAKKLIAVLKDYEIQVLPGISSVVALSAKLQTSWEDIKFISTHGREENIIAAVKTHTKVFSLLGGEHGVKQLCQKLMEYGLEDVILNIGEQLSYENEIITRGTPAELQNAVFSELCAVFIENSKARNTVITHGLSDSEFIRGQVPMTKEEVRSITVSKLKLNKDSVIYDIGAGTGSVSVEMALQAVDGIVYAIEKNVEAIKLIEENKRKFGAANLFAVLGEAPKALEILPAPTHAFIGGSQGNLKEIILALLSKNSGIRMVINAISLETIAEVIAILKTMEIRESEIVQVFVSKSKTLGAYHMMLGENPVYIISCTGGKTNGNA